MPAAPRPSDPADRAGAILTIDLDAVAANYRRLREELKGAPCAAVVKADAYGLGLSRVAPALWGAGARKFFTAQLDEAIALRAVLPEAEIHVLNGLMPGAEADYLAYRLEPVLNSLEEIARYRSLARDKPLPAILHVDTGMNRLGLEGAEVDILAETPSLLEGIKVTSVMSHLACADTSEHSMNRDQLRRFRDSLDRLPAAPRSFANSPGIFLGPDFHFDFGRPGSALYGVNPTPGKPNPMRQVIRLQGKILQVRAIDASESVGYGAAFRAKAPSRIATIAVGYADGYLRSVSHGTQAWVGGHEANVVGRISMDLVTLDVSGLPESLSRPGALVDLIGPEHCVDKLAERAGTIGYEILTSLGGRYHRVYRGR